MTKCRPAFTSILKKSVKFASKVWQKREYCESETILEMQKRFPQRSSPSTLKSILKTSKLK
jgi:hypothetical protein